jgi:hypothetical protein
MIFYILILLGQVLTGDRKGQMENEKLLGNNREALTEVQESNDSVVYHSTDKNASRYPRN